jgi:hypothetical protein
MSTTPARLNTLFFFGHRKPPPAKKSVKLTTGKGFTTPKTLAQEQRTGDSGAQGRQEGQDGCFGEGEVAEWVVDAKEAEKPFGPYVVYFIGIKGKDSP